MASSRPKRRAFDASTLRLLEELCKSTWAIMQDRHPFRDPNKDNELRHAIDRIFGPSAFLQLPMHKLLTTLSVKPCLVRSGIKKIAVDKTEGQNVEGQDTGN